MADESQNDAPYTNVIIAKKSQQTCLVKRFLSFLFRIQFHGFGMLRYTKVKKYPKSNLFQKRKNSFKIKTYKRSKRAFLCAYISVPF